MIIKSVCLCLLIYLNCLVYEMFRLLRSPCLVFLAFQVGAPVLFRTATVPNAQGAGDLPLRGLLRDSACNSVYNGILLSMTFAI